MPARRRTTQPQDHTKAGMSTNANAGASVNTATESGDASPRLDTPLSYYHELDEWQQDNHYIRSGYVRETGSYKECLRSLSYLHNETVNIYTHLLPSSIILIAVYAYINYWLEIYPNYLGVWEKINFLQFGLACTLCMFMSSTFHCIKSHSHRVSKFGNQLDYFGIVILITCSLISIMLFAFYDHPFWKYSFVGLFLVLGSICTVLTLDPRFATKEYRPLRSLMFVLFGLSGILPIIAAINIFGREEAVARSNAPWLIWEGIFYIGGAVLYAARFPERLTHQEINEDQHSLLEHPIKGTFDLFGHSHQIFHVMVVIAAYCHWVALVGCYHYLHQHTLPGLA